MFERTQHLYGNDFCVVLSCSGANVNRATANNDHTVVSLACAGGHLAVVELLLAHGADPTHRLKVTPLFSFYIILVY